MLEIDGSFGEGGGQILRTALSLSCLLKKPFRIFNIRKARRKPGLMPQHLSCVRALTLISGARVRGDSVGSTELIFEPSTVQPGEYLFDIGTAGSTTLLMQSLLPPLIFAKKRSSLILKGGTHVPFSPPFHYSSSVFSAMLKFLGISINAGIVSYGFYPKGGGKINIEISPAASIEPLTLIERGDIKKITGISGVGNLPLSIAERQRDAASKMLQLHGLNPEIEAIQAPCFGQGTFIFLGMESVNCIAGFSSLGERGKKAERVGEEAAIELLDYYKGKACLDSHLADQIVLYLALSDGISFFTATRITEHLITNLRVIEIFHEIEYGIEGERGKPGMVTIKGKTGIIAK
ncbi:MAG: RNA 3'-phosphate cyclase [Thermodesulfovibrionales bacterium]|nr:RNA 3'-phosphate cyclase [Nitrospinota bacterium]MCG2709459.1 RNA 3'-phosphate cyclase [Thermodesulfovibrionales bacterium]